MDIMPIFPDRREELIMDALQNLLTHKHLYQCSRIDEAKKLAFEKELKDGAESKLGGEKRVDEFRQRMSSPWALMVDIFVPGIADLYRIPRIETFCHNCDKRVAFVGTKQNTEIHNPSDQTFLLTYECQGLCNRTKVCFMVRRTGEKLQLVGRDTFEKVDVPSVLKVTKPVRKFYSDALVAFNAGQTLPAIFMLRTFIEQYWKSIPEVMRIVSGNAKPTGEELGDAYKETLSLEFKTVFPTLTKEYENLSGAIHSATADETVFSSVLKQIEAHFTALSAVNLTK